MSDAINMLMGTGLWFFGLLTGWALRDRKCQREHAALKPAGEE